MMFEAMRRRIALWIAPELATFTPTAVRPEPANERLATQRDLGDDIRKVAGSFFAAGGELPVWKRDREWLEGLGYNWMSCSNGKTVITRLVRDHTAGVTVTNYHAALRMLSLSWPLGARWPRDVRRPGSKDWQNPFPRPARSKDAA